jgi:hypothetical protein
MVKVCVLGIVDQAGFVNNPSLRRLLPSGDECYPDSLAPPVNAECGASDGGLGR